MEDRSASIRDVLLKLAGISTILLVGFVINPSGPERFGLAPEYLAYGGVGVFLVAMLCGDWIEVRLGSAALLGIESIAALIVIAVAPGSAAPILVIVIVAQAAFLLELRALVALAALLNGTVFGLMVGVWGMSAWDALLTVSLFMTFQMFAMLVANFARAAEAARIELKEVNAELLATRSLLLESARDRERLRLSRELHDVAGHTLTALKFNLRRLARDVRGERRNLAEESLALADHLLEDVRALVGNFRKTDGIAVDGAIRELTAPFDRPRFELSVDDGTAVPDLDAARVLVNVVREAITNVVRHAQADRCCIALRREGDGFLLEIDDDGRGMGASAPGQGIRGMRERLEAAGGTLEISTGPLGGTRIKATLGATA